MQNQIHQALDVRQPLRLFSDAIIFQQICSDSPDTGFSQFLNQSQTETLLLHYFKRRGFDHADAQDLQQETLLAFFLNLRAGKFEFWEGCSLVHYLFGIARKQCYKAMRKRFGKKYQTISLESHPSAAAISDDASDGEVPLQEQALMASFREMDNRSRRLLWGYHVENDSYQVLAKELGMADWRVACQQTYRKRIELKRATVRRLSAA